MSQVDHTLQTNKAFLFQSQHIYVMLKVLIHVVYSKVLK